MSNTKPLTKPRVLKALRKAVAARGEDYVYDAPIVDGVKECVYVAPETYAPSCLVALVLEDLMPETWRGLKTVQRNIPASSLHSYDDVATPAAAQILRRAQSAQDQRHPYGKVLEKVESMVIYP